MADVEEVRARAIKLAEPYGLLAEVHEVESAPSGVSAGGPRVEVIVINRHGLQISKHVSCEAFRRAGDEIFDAFIEEAAQELTAS